MNDEFLHALRRDPPPEFARKLKRRLHAQPAPRSTRSWTVRAMLAAFLIGGLAMAAALLLREESEPPGEAAPIAQRAAPSAQAQVTQPAGTAKPEGQIARNHSTPSQPPAQQSAAEDPRGTFATSRLPRPIAQALVDSLRAQERPKPHVAVMDDEDALRALCENADFAMVSRRITEAELTRCWNRRIEVAEWKLGHQAVVLTAGPMADSALLTPRDVFLALARRIPDPANPSLLIDNPNVTWHDVDARFDHRRIDVFMPSDAVTRAAFVQLVMEPGCETYRWIRALKQTDRPRFDDVCHQLRSDERIHEVELSGTVVTQRLWAEPNWLVVLDYSSYTRFRADVLGTMLEGPAATLASLTDGTYPAARPVYVYAQRLRAMSNAANRSMIFTLTDGLTLGARQGLVRQDEPARRRDGFPGSLPSRLESLKPEEPSR
jgi:ABC-type phosphate transport system substrate-binding protein